MSAVTEEENQWKICDHNRKRQETDIPSLDYLHTKTGKQNALSGAAAEKKCEQPVSKEVNRKFVNISGKDNK